jgi:hypothetical protein
LIGVAFPAERDDERDHADQDVDHAVRGEARASQYSEGSALLRLPGHALGRR